MSQDHLQKRTHHSSFARRFALAAAAAFLPVASSAQDNSHAGYVASVATYSSIAQCFAARLRVSGRVVGWPISTEASRKLSEHSSR
jgi:surface antigen